MVWNVDGSIGNMFQSLVVCGKKEFEYATQLHCDCTIRETWPLVTDCDRLHLDEEAMSTWWLKILYIIVKRLFRRRCSKVGHPRSWIILVTLQL